MLSHLLLSFHPLVASPVVPSRSIPSSCLSSKMSWPSNYVYSAPPSALHSNMEAQSSISIILPYYGDDEDV
ncbi:hypothetical protein EJ08DRAFT_644597 [Tothia fuscella]|uniref:Uncharacterized protein n=1 Tax=Tothia fuscella TaxID=1048955 RepID=A0A9P4P5Q1_9PEZI|nr:hypothetical protein EJ08DRAFT_644597 [Tothia fuscella]